MANTMVWQQAGRLFVVVHTTEPPTRQEWDQYVRAVAAASAETQELRILIRSQGGAPDGGQRKQLTEAIDVQRLPSAVLTDNVVARAVGTAVGWFVRDLKVFDYTALPAAYAYLQLSSSECARASDVLAEIEHRLLIPQKRRRDVR